MTGSVKAVERERKSRRSGGPAEMAESRSETSFTIGGFFSGQRFGVRRLDWECGGCHDKNWGTQSCEFDFEMPRRRDLLQGSVRPARIDQPQREGPTPLSKTNVHLPGSN